MYFELNELIRLHTNMYKIQFITKTNIGVTIICYHVISVEMYNNSNKKQENKNSRNQKSIRMMIHDF